jgi:hypothetical protein
VVAPIGIDDPLHAESNAAAKLMLKAQRLNSKARIDCLLTKTHID